MLITVGCVDSKPVGFQSWMFGGWRGGGCLCLRGRSWCGVHIHSLGRSPGAFEFSLDCGGGVPHQLAAQPLPPTFTGFSPLSDAWKWLRQFLGFFFFFSEEVVSYGAVDWLWLWEEVNSGSSYVTILSQNPDVDFLVLKIIKMTNSKLLPQ